ncbi:MAG TPA: tetratricopeptide repeat protein [Saprospiraceae bacterium]|jgi:tetratricopeptide (TPR) repeat protein|nr:tetratricopeptide repeat protein [Saprospiraceae bacterium]HRO08076.1 tetratricopeptide repeat protein [Saprospiraceae bacterium]HRP41337.1 tetratricopeptide repeat protein [Saprospiraceae bacterium]
MRIVFSWAAVFFAMVQILTAQTDLTPGIKMISNENYSDATVFFEKIMKAEPRNGLPVYYLGKIKYELEDFGAAQELFDKAVTTDKKCALCSIGQAQMWLENGKTMEGDKAMTYLALKNKKSATILAAIGDAYLFSRKPDYKLAIEYLTKSRDIDPNVGSTWAHLGDAFTKDNQAGNAMNAYETAVRKDSKNVEAYISMAKIWRATKNKEQAIENLQTAVKLAPDFAPAYKALYETYMKFGENDKVLPVLEKYVSLAGTDELAKLRLIRFMHTEAKDYDRVIQNANELKKTSKDYTLDRWLAYAHTEKENYAIADSFFTLLDTNLVNINEDPYDADFYYKGKVAMGLKNYDKALEFYHKLWEKNPAGRIEVLGNIAKRFYDEKDYDNAIRFYKEKALYADLEVSEQYFLAGAYYAKKDYTQALQEFHKLVEVSPNYAIGWYNIAKCVEKSDPEHITYPAMADYVKFIEVVNGLTEQEKAYYKNYVIEGYMYIGYGNVAKEDNKAAKAAFEQVLLINPDHERAKEYVALLSK